MKKVVLILVLAMASFVSFGQKAVVGVGLTNTGNHGDPGRVQVEAGVQKGWSTISLIGETPSDEWRNGYSVGANYRLAFGDQVFKPFVSVGGTVDLYGTRALGVRPAAGLVISKPANSPVGLILYGQGNYKQRAVSYYEGGAKLILTF